MTNAVNVNYAHYLEYVDCAGVKVPHYFSLECLVRAIARRRFRMLNAGDVIAAFQLWKDNGHVSLG
jgi:hypothetical protein